MKFGTGGIRAGKTSLALELMRRWQIEQGGNPEAKLHVLGRGRHDILRPAENAEFKEVESLQIGAAGEAQKGGAE